MAKTPQHKRLYNLLKHDILSGKYKEGELLPSELELASRHKLARATVRQALSDLKYEGTIAKRQGKGSIVTDGSNKIGILNIKGFLKGAKKPSNEFILQPHKTSWPEPFFYELTSEQREAGCIFIKRLRTIDGIPVILELTYIPDIGLPDFCATPFINDSLFETLNKRYLIEVLNVEEDLRAVKPNDEALKYLDFRKSDPMLQINFKFICNRAELNIYSMLYCDTQNCSIGNII
ncbi:MAG TPA: GntR family transcriptional regulator [Bacteroidales bacterium]|nr:GntR family transcriptional regulator [Bacteroidales bacterium]